MISRDSQFGGAFPKGSSPPTIKASETPSSPTAPDSSVIENPQWEGHIADDIAATYGPEPLAMLTVTAEGLVLTSTRGNYRLAEGMHARGDR